MVSRSGRFLCHQSIPRWCATSHDHDCGHRSWLIAPILSSLLMTVIFEETLDAQLREEMMSECDESVAAANKPGDTDRGRSGSDAAIEPQMAVGSALQQEQHTSTTSTNGVEEYSQLLPAGHVPSDDAAQGTVRKGAMEGHADALQAETIASLLEAAVEAAERPRQRSSCCECAPKEGGWRARLRIVCEHSAFGTGSMMLVLVNMALMCMPYHGMEVEYAAAIEEASGWITWVFVWEMGLKLIAMGCVGYWSDGWNQLDGMVVLISIVDMVPRSPCPVHPPAPPPLALPVSSPCLPHLPPRHPPHHPLHHPPRRRTTLTVLRLPSLRTSQIATALFSGSGVRLSFLRIVRMLRVLRVLRLMRSWRGLYKVISTFIKAVPHMINISILMVRPNPSEVALVLNDAWHRPAQYF